MAIIIQHGEITSFPDGIVLPDVLFVDSKKFMDEIKRMTTIGEKVRAIVYLRMLIVNPDFPSSMFSLLEAKKFIEDNFVE